VFVDVHVVVAVVTKEITFGFVGSFALFRCGKRYSNGMETDLVTRSPV
jgi:hypothetical protein